MVNNNLYEDQPYLPSRDPREVNIVERLKDIRETDPVFVNDEDIQRSDLEKEVSIIVEKVVDELIGDDEDSGNDGGTTGDTEVLYQPAVFTAATSFEFPTIGSENQLYLAKEENNGKGYLYRWCTEQNCYLRPEDSTDDISLINGGNAFSDTL